jgi:hypothetical protein
MTTTHPDIAGKTSTYVPFLDRKFAWFAKEQEP